MTRKRQPGAGRKPIAAGGAERHTVTLTPADWRYIEAFGGTRSAALRRLILFASTAKLREKYGDGTP